MILELADIRIQPGQQAAFDEAIERAVSTVASKAKGFRGFKINKGIESPERYLLQISGTRWKTTRWTFAVRLLLANGARLLGRFLPRRRWWSISICWSSRIEADQRPDRPAGFSTRRSTTVNSMKKSIRQAPPRLSRRLVLATISIAACAGR